MVLDGVSRATGSFTGAANFSISDNGTLAYVRSAPSGTPRLMDIAIVEDPSGQTKPSKADDSARSVRVASCVSRRTHGGRRRGSQQGARRDLHHRDERCHVTPAPDARRRATTAIRPGRTTAGALRISPIQHRGIWWQAADQHRPGHAIDADSGGRGTHSRIVVRGRHASLQHHDQRHRTAVDDACSKRKGDHDVIKHERNQSGRREATAVWNRDVQRPDERDVFAGLECRRLYTDG